MFKKNQQKQYYVAIIGNFPLFIIGIHAGWSSPSLPKLQTEEFPFEVTNDEASLIATSGFLGVIISSLLILKLVDLIGRKKTLIALTIPLILSFAFIYLSFYAKILIYLGRIAGGMSEGALLVMCGMYVAEISEPEIRGALSCIGPFFFTCGALTSNIISSYLTLYNAALVYLTFPCVFLILFSTLPETPYYYLMKKQTAEAVKVLKYLLNKTNVVKEMDGLSFDVNRQMSESGTFKDLFVIKSNRKAIFIMIGVRALQQYTGCTALTYYVQLLLKDAVPSIPPVLSSSLIIIPQIIMACFCSIFVDKFGRKPLLILSSVGCLLALVIEAVYFTLRDYTDINTSSFELLPLILSVVYAISFYFGLGSVMPLILSELFSQSVKAKAVCLISITYAVSAFSSTKFYQFSSDSYGIAVPFYTFAFFTFLAILLFAFVVPETKNKSLEEIQQVLKGNKS